MALPYSSAGRGWLELGLKGPAWQTPEHVVGNGAAVLDASRANGLEGVVAKRLDCPYEPGRRSPCWVKGSSPAHRRRRRRLAARGGTPPGPHRGAAGGRGGGRPLRYAGRVGTGFTDDELGRLAKTLVPREDSPFAAGDPPRGAVFVEPDRVAEVAFLEWTPDGMLREPSYKGLREETAPSAFLDAGTPVKGGVEVVVAGRRLKVTNPDKVLFPEAGFTKRDVIEYLVHVAPALLPHLDGRPLTLKRYPDGVEGKLFFEKNARRTGPNGCRPSGRRDRRRSTSAWPGPAHARLAGQPRRPGAAHARCRACPRYSGRR